MKRKTFKMDNKVEVNGIDHGWSGMKTMHEVFSNKESHIQGNADTKPL